MANLRDDLIIHLQKPIVSAIRFVSSTDSMGWGWGFHVSIDSSIDSAYEWVTLAISSPFTRENDGLHSPRRELRGLSAVKPSFWLWGRTHKKARGRERERERNDNLERQ